MGTQSTFSNEFDRIVADYHAQPRLQVWSLVITLFGDTIVPRGGRSPLGLISAATGAAGIEQGAVRTAMSRLAADGWVIREREGRLSYYRLAGEGRQAFDEATRRIYAAPGDTRWTGSWNVVVVTNGGDAATQRMLADAGYFKVAGQTWLKADTGEANDHLAEKSGILRVTGPAGSMPAEVMDLAREAAGEQRFRAFSQKWVPTAEMLETNAPADGLQALALRILLIHDWRRLVLRSVPLPKELTAADRPAERARETARRIYARLVKPSEAWLEAEGMPVQRDPLAFAQRFGIQPAIGERI